MEHQSDTTEEVSSVAKAIVLGYDRRVPGLHNLFFCMAVRSSRGSSAIRLNMPSVLEVNILLCFFV